MNLCAISKNLGLDENYFSYMRSTNRKKYTFILSFDKNPEKAVRKYIQYAENIIVKMGKILPEYSEKPKEYAALLFSLGLTVNVSNPGVVYAKEEQRVYTVREDAEFLSLMLSLLQKWEKIVKYHEEQEAS